jgi:outer membrane receptor protein involved in Fe transport
LGINNAPFIDDNYYNTESAIWIHGRHTFEFGGDFRHQLFGTHNDLSAGSYNFQPLRRLCRRLQGKTFMEPASAMVSRAFALGQLSGASIGNDNIQWFHRLEGAFYALDTWKLTRKLTVNYGLRWDLEQMQREQYLRETQFSPTVVNPSAGGLLGGTEYEGYGTGVATASSRSSIPG